LLTTDLPLGAHQSIAGGTPRAVERGIDAGGRVLQIFVKNNARWLGKAIPKSEARQFRVAVRNAGLSHVAAHASYLINLASPSAALRRRSAEALRDEILRCADLGIRDLVLHPGSHGGDGEARGVDRISAELRQVLEETAETRVRILLETAAGQGAAVGHRFEHLRDILARVVGRRIGICVDTCHVHAAGYELSTAEGYSRTWRAFAEAIGLPRLHAIHVNDSKTPLGSRVDRHEHIGRGSIGLAGFRQLMTDPLLATVPKFLETPKDPARDFDRLNLARLRRLAASARRNPGAIAP